MVHHQHLPFTLLLALLVVVLKVHTVEAFPLLLGHHQRQTRYYQELSSNRNVPSLMLNAKNAKNDNNDNINSAQFELQELSAQGATMVEKGIASADLTPEKMRELTNYVETICTKRKSPVPLRDIGMPENKEKYLNGSTWRLAFCTENAAMSVMPREARIVVEIVDNAHLNYILEFSKKVQGLSKIVAKSTYMIDCSPINPGLLTFSYESISSEMLGMTVPVGFFGMLKGRSNYIESIYFDGKVWIERGYSNDSGEKFYNVYIKDEQMD